MRADKALNRNYVRILDQSTKMFNEKGVVGVTVQSIGKALSISPGNITYHFKKKTDIIHAIIDRLETELLDLLDTGVHLNTKVEPQQHYKLVESIGRVLWRYRFVFNNVLYLQTLDKRIGKRFKEFQVHVIETMVELVHQSVNNRWIKPSRAPKSYQMLSENMWYIWLSSVRLSQLESKQLKTSEQISILTMLTHHMAYMENYYNDKMYHGLEKYLEQLDSKS